MGEPGTKEILNLEDLEASGGIRTGRKHVLSILVENKPGVLARIAGLFARRGFNIDSLAVGATDDTSISRITLTLDAPGAMFTASHNPARYNGVKFCLAGARPVGADTGLDVVKATAEAVLDGGGPAPADRAGRTERGRPAAAVDAVHLTAGLVFLIENMIVLESGVIVGKQHHQHF